MRAIDQRHGESSVLKGGVGREGGREVDGYRLISWKSKRPNGLMLMRRRLFSRRDKGQINALRLSVSGRQCLCWDWTLGAAGLRPAIASFSLSFLLSFLSFFLSFFLSVSVDVCVFTYWLMRVARVPSGVDKQPGCPVERVPVPSPWIN